MAVSFISNAIHVRVTYEDGGELSVPADEWPRLRSDGVQDVVVSACGKSVRFASQSLYWLYPEGEDIVAGAGSVRYDPNPLVEIIVSPDGAQSERRVEFMPDMKHEQVKLGWWKRG